MEIVTEFIFLGSKVTADDDCIHEIKIPLLLWKKAMTNIDSKFKSKEELKGFLMRLKEESEKAGLKFNIQITKIMACSPITS